MLLASTTLVWAQQQPSSLTEETEENLTASCLEPPPLLRWQDYHGPFERVVGVFGRKLERTTVHPPHYKPGAVLCSLEARGKFSLFVHDTLDPVSFLSAGFNAGLDQANNRDRAFGQGAAGYGDRFGANFADETSARFFKVFAFPVIFSEDPRYYRLAHGTTGKRMLHAAEHAFIGHRDDGTRMFNYSEWLGTGSAAALSYAYHPGNQRGFESAARGVSYSIAGDIGFDMLREFWPDIARKLRMPFRDTRGPLAMTSGR